MLKNAERDGAEFAWVPRGDTCAFCLTLASRGWQRMSKKALKNGHAEHIHANCDCQYAVRFDGKSSVEGYDPEKLREEYYSFEGTPDEKINAWRRKLEAPKRDEINARRRANYALVQSGGKVTGGHYYRLDENATKRDIEAAKKYEEFSRKDDSAVISKNTGFSKSEIHAIRRHIFYNKHDLDKGFARFDPDYDMAVAWERLKKGTFLPTDITLLRHELLECQLEKEYNLTARQAHELAQQKYNWQKQLIMETQGKGEKDGIL